MNPDRPLARELSTLVREGLTTLPVVVVTGMRQAGKTTFLRHEPSLAHRRYFTLDDLATFEVAERQPEALLASAEAILAIEVKTGSRFGGRDLTGLSAFVAQAREPTVGVLAYGGSELLPLGQDLWAVPLGLLVS